MAGKISSLVPTLSKLWVSASVTAFFVVAASCFKEALGAEQSLELHNFSQTADNTQVVIFLSVVSAAAFLIIAVLLVTACTDCYNSEVSTECHPAAASGGAKWGGAGGYASVAATDVNDAVMGAGFSTGEQVVIPRDGGQPLPYAMIPSQVPEAQGFRGYGNPDPPAGYGNPDLPAAQGNPGPPAAQGYGAVAGYSPAGYSAAGWGSGSGPAGQSRGRTGSQSLPGAHINPADMLDPQDPPPPYMDEWLYMGNKSVATTSVSNSVTGAYFMTGKQVLLPGQGSHLLPYSMFPSEASAAQGCQVSGASESAGAQGYGAVAGYSASGWGTGSGGFRGYGPPESPAAQGYGAVAGNSASGGGTGCGPAGQSRGRTGSQSLPRAGVSPADVMLHPQEPPPPYMDGVGQ